MSNRLKHPEQRLAAAEAELAILNIAAYRFVAIHNREQLREQWLEQCLALGMKGTLTVK